MAGSVIANLKILLSATWEKLRSDFGKAKKEAQGFSSQIKGGLGVAVSSLTGIGGAAGAAIGQVGALGASLASLGPIALAVAASVGVLIGAFAFSKYGVELAAQNEQAQVSFETMLGSAEQAKQVLQDITAFAAATPFQKTELVDASRQLVAFGVQAGDVVPTLRMLGDVAAGINQPIGEIAEIFGKAKVQGRLFAEDINQFQGRGIPIMQALADTIGVTTEEIRAMVTDGEIGFAEMQTAFEHLTGSGSQFGGMMEKQSQTLNGLWSTVKDNFAQLAAEIGEVLLPLIKAITEGLVQFLKINVQIVKMVKRDLFGFKDVKVELPKEDFAQLGKIGQEALDGVTESAKKQKEELIDIQRLARDIRSESSVDRGGIAAVDARTVAGFSAVQAAQREARFQENLPVELAKRILDKMDELIAKKQEIAVKRHRS